MDITIDPGPLAGTVSAIPSKSQAHRLLICAAFADRETRLLCPETNRDIEATAGCLCALGAEIRRTPEGYTVSPIQAAPQKTVLDCGESGSTLRFLLPIAGALGVDATFLMAGRLPERPLSPLWEELERMGLSLSRPQKNAIRSIGRLESGAFTIDGGVSSQFITGLLFAAALLSGPSQISITGKLESRPYLEMTQKALCLFGVDTAGFSVRGGQRFQSPGEIAVEGDWSNAAFFLGAAALGNPVEVTGLDPASAQGDRAAADWLPRLEGYCTIDMGDIPDLAPLLAVVAGAKQGAQFTNIRRLRMKESDRAASIAAMLTALGAHAEAGQNELRIRPGVYRGCTVDAVNDHRIAMAAAMAATVAAGPVTILGAECVEKSYPSFWAEYRRLGGRYEQHLR